VGTTAVLGEGVVALSVAVEKSLRLALVGSVCALLAAPDVQSRKDVPDWFIPAANAASLGLPADFADIVDKVKPAVIGVRARVEADGRDPRRPLPPGSFPAPSFQQQEVPRGGRDAPFDILPNRPDAPVQPRASQGSGFFISADGYAVTTNHVIDHGKTIEITTDDGKRYAAKLVGADPKTDLALLKVKGGGEFASVQLADKTPRIGEWILAIGNPFGLGGTVTAGIISARARDIGLGDFDDFLQIDAPVTIPAVRPLTSRATWWASTVQSFLLRGPASRQEGIGVAAFGAEFLLCNTLCGASTIRGAWTIQRPRVGMPLRLADHHSMGR
jgi:serine protease Do